MINNIFILINTINFLRFMKNLTKKREQCLLGLYNLKLYLQCLLLYCYIKITQYLKTKKPKETYNDYTRLQ